MVGHDHLRLVDFPIRADRMDPDGAIVVDMADLKLLVGLRFLEHGVDFLGGDKRTDLITMVLQGLQHDIRAGSKILVVSVVAESSAAAPDAPTEATAAKKFLKSNARVLTNI